MIPFGMDCPESITAIAAEAKTVPSSLLDGGTVVVSCGSGVTLAGLLRGLNPMPRCIIGISAGRSLAKLRRCISKYVPIECPNVTLIEASIPYDSAPALKCPFPAHPNYDLKAWKYLVEHIDCLKPPILFWNIGA